MIASLWEDSETKSTYNEEYVFILDTFHLFFDMEICRSGCRDTLFFLYKNLVYKNVKAWIVKKNKNISEGYKSGLFLNLAYVLMNRYQGFSYLTVLKNKRKYNLKQPQIENN